MHGLEAGVEQNVTKDPNLLFVMLVGHAWILTTVWRQRNELDRWGRRYWGFCLIVLMFGILVISTRLLFS